MIDQQIDKVNDLIDSAKHITIVVRENPGLDAMAAGLALYLSLVKIDKKVTVICANQPTVALANLVGIDKVKQNHETGGKGLIISLPYSQGEIEKISYDIVGEKINLTVVPGERGLSFTTDDISFQTPSETTDLLFTVGVTSEADVAAFPADLPLINIDISSKNSGFGTVSLVSSIYSSNSEIVNKILTELALPMDVDIAQNLLSGITSATENFQSDGTSSFAFEAAAALLKKGARRKMEAAQLPRGKFISEAKDIPVEEEEDRVVLRQRPFKPQDGKQTPKDWLTPKIYKGSSLPIS